MDGTSAMDDVIVGTFYDRSMTFRYLRRQIVRLCWETGKPLTEAQVRRHFEQWSIDDDVMAQAMQQVIDEGLLSTSVLYYLSPEQVRRVRSEMW
jgi:hypothetical protein